jgi:hypothetical protein
MIRIQNAYQVRVHRKDTATVVGSGFLIDKPNKIIVTCAHVVASALNGVDDYGTFVNQSVWIDFPFVSMSASLETKVICVKPLKADNSGDIALLKVVSDLPAESQAARLAIMARYDGLPFSVIGCPEGLQDEGRSVDGRLQSRNFNRQIQAVGTSEFGGFVEQGFSGAPVLAKELNVIIGMMSRIETPVETKLAFITSIEEIVEIYPDLDYEDRTRSSSEKSRSVYVSYAAEDEVIAHNIANDIESEDFRTVLAHKEADENYQTENDYQVRSAKVIIVLLTGKSVASHSVDTDWNNALNNYVPVIPVINDRVEVPVMLRAFSPIVLYESFRTGILKLKERLKSIDETYPQFLMSLLKVWEQLSAESNSAYRFVEKVTRLRQFMTRFPKPYSPIDILTLEQRIEEFLEKSTILFPEAPASESTARIVGQRLDDIKTFFRDRTTQQRELAKLIADESARAISIIGRGGIGKSSLVSKVMGEIESGENNYVRRDQIKGILYLSNRDQEITSERLYIAGAQLIGGDAEKRLRDLWAKPLVSLEDKFSQFVHELRQDLFVVVLDNFEDQLDEGSYLRDKSLQLFFEIFLQGKHRTKLIITTREPVQLPLSFMHHERRLIIMDGLPPQDAISMLHDLDMNGDYGIRETDHDTLVELVEKVHGVPRALQVVTSILAESPLLSLRDLLNQDELFKREKFIEALVSENYRRLNTDSRHVLNVLAVFERPVPAAAVGFVLQPFLPDLDVEHTLKRLIMTHVVSANRTDKLVYLHPIDRDYIYGYLKYEYEKTKKGEST